MASQVATGMDPTPLDEMVTLFDFATVACFLGMAGAFLSLRRVLPQRYPLDRDLDTYLADENNVGRLLDYGVIVPRIQRLYDWSAEELGQPGTGGDHDGAGPVVAARVVHEQPVGHRLEPGDLGLLPDLGTPSKSDEAFG